MEIRRQKGRGVLRSVYGPGYGCVSRELVPEPELPETALSETALPGAPYFQPDINGLGGVLQYAGSDVWGRRREQEENGGSGFQGQLRFISYSYDPIIGKYFAQARFYDAEQGRMMGKDPMKRGLNAYPYCDNDPVNYVDPTGEIANIVAGGIAGGVIGGAFGFAGSAVSQLMSGERFSMRKALGSAANGAVVGAVRGALVGSGIGIGTSLAANFIGGAAGSALEQKIGSGRVSLKESVVSGATNAVSGAIYGKGPLKGFGDALWKGAASGAATAGIRYLARGWDDGGSDLAGSVLGLVQTIGRMAISPYSKNRDPRRGCGVHSPLSNRVGEPMAYGYRYDVGSLKSAGGVRRKKDGFSMLGLLKEAAIGGVMGGLAGTAFYGAGKAFGFLKDSVRDVRGNKGGVGDINNSNMMFRKAKDDSCIEPMPKKQLQRIVKAFKKQGGIIQMDDATDAYLMSKNAEAITLNENTILLRQKPGRASVFEELIHATQFRQNLNDGSVVSRIQNEITAQKMLLRNSKIYKLTPAEVKQTQSALASYIIELEQLMGGN